jgi:hypothetical protein
VWGHEVHGVEPARCARLLHAQIFQQRNGSWEWEPEKMSLEDVLKSADTKGLAHDEL